MKIQPVRHLRSVEYPSVCEAQRDPELLKNVPARWEKSPGFAVMLGLLALSSNSRAEGTVEGLPTAQVEVLPEGLASERETS